jgi:predicted Rossmann-fold nucleotide-binding protein
VKQHSFLLGLLLVLIAGGIGVFNELLELLAVIVLHVGPQVGDYLNNTLDLLYNTLGSVVASIFVISYHRK